MLLEEFENSLKDLGLSKKEFSEITGLAQSSVFNWNNSGKTPSWVDSWIQNYKSKRVLDTVITAIDSVRNHSKP